MYTHTLYIYIYIYIPFLLDGQGPGPLPFPWTPSRSKIVSLEVMKCYNVSIYRKCLRSWSCFLFLLVSFILPLACTFTISCTLRATLQPATLDQDRPPSLSPSPLLPSLPLYLSLPLFLPLYLPPCIRRESAIFWLTILT